MAVQLHSTPASACVDQSISCFLPRLTSVPLHFPPFPIPQKVNLGFHFDVEQRARSHLGWFFNFNGTAGVWRLEVRPLFDSTPASIPKALFV